MVECPACEDRVETLFCPFDDSRYTAVCSDCQSMAECYILEAEGDGE